MIDSSHKLNLSGQEERVLHLSMSGLADKQVAQELGLSTDTVRTYWQRIREKANGATRPEIFAVVVRQTAQLELDRQQAENERLQREIQRRKEVEVRLRQSEHRFRAVTEASPSGIFVTDPVGGLLYGNAKFLDMTELTSETLQGLSWLDAVCPGKGDEECRSWNIADVALGHLNEFRLQPAAGHELWVQIRAGKIEDNGSLLGYVGVIEDVTEARRREGLLRQSHDLIERAANWSSEMLYIYDLEKRCNIYANASMCQFLGKSPAQIANFGDRLFLEIAHPDDLPMIAQGAVHILELADGESLETRYRLRSADGDWHPVVSSDRVFARNALGQPTQIFGAVRDLTNELNQTEQIDIHVLELHETQLELELRQQELETLNVHLSNMAMVDGLTGLKNHRSFQERMEEAFSETSTFSLFLLDIDHFKQFNDSFGHPAGDDLLREFARLLTEFANPTDFVARYGGEEFAMICFGLSEEEATQRAQELVSVIGQHDWPYRQVTVSVGVSSFHQTHPNRQAMIECADRALYRAKESGRNRAVHAQTLACPTSLRFE